MWYDEEFYEEPSEFEEKVEELKDSLANAVKVEILEELEKLKKENEELQRVKENLDQIKRVYETKTRELERAISNAEYKARRLRAEEIMEEYKIFLWRPAYNYLYGPKCDICDNNRQIEVELPSGKKVKDDCKCGITSRVAYPERMLLHSISDRQSKIVAWYKACGKEKERYYCVDYAASVYADKAIVEPGTSFDELDNRENHDILFKTREDCLAYCEYLNKKNGAQPDIAYKRNGDKYESEEEENTWEK